MKINRCVIVNGILAGIICGILGDNGIGCLTLSFWIVVILISAIIVNTTFSK